MEDQLKTQISSLDIVHDEFNIAVQEAVNGLEQFIDDRNNAELLESFLERVKQIEGTLRLVQLEGAAILADETIRLATTISVGTDESKDEALGLLGESLLLLSRYVEYIVQRRAALPPLLISFINNIRMELKEPPLSERYFFDQSFQGEYFVVNSAPTLPEEDLIKLFARMRHMYQVGLLGVIQDKKKVLSFEMMLRSIDRLSGIAGNRKQGKLWSLSSAVITLFTSGKMEINRSRKLMLGAIDRQIKTLVKDGWQALEVDPPVALIDDLLYLIAISGDDSETVQQIKNAYSIPALAYTDAQLIKQREILSGPNADTVASVSRILKEELQHGKEILDIAARREIDPLQSFVELSAVLVKVSDILLVVGLTIPSETLKEQVVEIQSWIENAEPPSDEELINVADALLFVESTISGLEKLQLTEDKISEAGGLARHEIIASNQLAEAEIVVIREAQVGMALVKRALNSFEEARFDKVHIASVNESLNSVRGGLVVLGLDRAAVVSQCCIDFVDQCLLNNDDIGAIQHMLETFADVIISLEYYLDEVAMNKDVEDKVLEIAEESLDVLGFSIAA